MHIDRQQLICGLKPAALKKLLRREKFSTLSAMEDLDLAEPAISRKLAELEGEGWISFTETRDFMDHWESTEQGNRLSATRLIKRFPIHEGRAIVERVVEEARAINANPDCLQRITEIILFGSVLTGPDDGDAGDIDLVVHVYDRQVSDDEKKRLEAIEEAAMPRYLHFFQRMFWGADQLQRRIKRVSNKISLHGPSDLAVLGCPHRTVYAYTLATEQEVASDPAIRTAEPSPEAEKARKRRRSKEAPPRSPDVQAWPVAPNRPASLDYVGIESLRRLQHMWMKGASLATIARRTRFSQRLAQAYLASRQDVRERHPFTFDASLGRTISQALTPGFSHHIMNRIYAPAGSEPTVETEIYDGETFEELVNIRRFTRLRHIFKGRCDLLPVAEPINDAAWFWLQRMRDRLRGVGLYAWEAFAPNNLPEPLVDSTPMDFRPLARPLLDLFKSQTPPPAWGHRLEVVLEGRRLELNYWTGHPFYGGSKSKRITKANAGEVWSAAKAFVSRFAEPLSAGGGYTVFVWGQQLEDGERGKDNDDLA